MEQFCLPDLPDTAILCLWQHCTPDARKALFQSCLAFRENPLICAKVTSLAHTLVHKHGVVVPRPRLQLECLRRVRLGMRPDFVPRTHIERFFKYATSKWLRCSVQALLSDFSARHMLSTATHVELQAWDLDDTDAEPAAQELSQLFPALCTLDLTSCQVGPAFLKTLQAATVTAARYTSEAYTSTGSSNPRSIPIRGTNRPALTVVMPLSSQLAVLQAACPELELALPAASSSSQLDAPKSGSPPRWALSPCRMRPSGARGVAVA